MAYFKPAPLSFNAPRDFFDNVGKNAPVTKINIEMPREMVDASQASFTGNDTLQPVDPQLLSQIQTAILREYGGVAKQCLKAFRQGGSLSNLAIQNRSSALDAGVGMHYSSQFGREIVNISVSPDVVRKLVGAKDETRYMLVLYGSNQIAALPMSQLDTAQFSSPIKKTLPVSDFSNYYGYTTTQLKFSNTFHALATGLSFNDDGTITVFENSGFFKVYNTKQKLVGGGADADGFINIINGSGDTIYADCGQSFTVTSSGIVPATMGYGTRFWVIDANGNPYAAGEVQADGGSAIVSGISQLTSISLGNYGGTTPFPGSYKWKLWDGSAIGEPTISHADPIATNPGATAPWERVHPSGGGGTASTLVYRNDGNLDYVDVETISMSVSVSITGSYDKPLSATDTEKHTYEDYSVTASYGSISYSVDVKSDYLIFSLINPSTDVYGSGVGIRVSGYPLIFPYSFSADPKSSNFFLQKIDGAGTSYENYSSYGPIGSAVVAGVVHASNGKHVLQMWDERGADVRHIHLDKTKEITNSLAAAIGCDPWDIVSILLDIKKSDIDKLK